VGDLAVHTGLADGGGGAEADLIRLPAAADERKTPSCRTGL